MQRISILRYQTLLVLPMLFALLGSVLSPLGVAHTQKAQLSDPPADQVAVKLKSGVSINTILTRYHASLLGKITETNLYFLQLPSGQTADQVLPTLNADTDLWYAEPNYYVEGAPGGTYITFGATGGVTPTPAGVSDQWAWIKTGLADAQKISTGQGIIVAVLDTGLTPDHPLLSSSITAGYDFVDMNNSISDVGNGLDDNGNGLVDEGVGHGTHISGIIETEAPGVQIMPIRVLNSDGVGTYWEVAAGIRYAVDHSAKVINMSMSAPRLTPSFSDALSYAASHGVIVVAAAGTGTGPNYPAAYSDKLAVIGVGATDQNDTIASFSGGQPADTDVFAPGVHIYSAYAYDGYAYGSGTSMAAPIVAAEAALLMSRHPDWSATEVTQRILAMTVPVAGSNSRRIDLAGALTTGLEIDHASPDLTASPTDGYITPRLRLFNNTPQDIPLSELTIRYWYTIDGYRWQTFLCDYATIVGCSNLTGTFTTLASNSPNKTSLSDTYLEVGFPASAGSLAGGAQIVTYLRILKTDLSSFNELNDYSYDDPTKPDMTRWNRITVYRNGVLVWGTEPTGGGTSSATPTATIVTNTPTRTRTATLANNTPTRTKTPVAITNTSTRTSTPTRTRTPTTASPTRTITPLTPTVTVSVPSSVKLQYMTGNTSSSSQAISPQLILFNTGTTSIALNEFKIRYWFTVDGDKPQNYWCDYAFLGCGNITSHFVLLPVPRSGADYYLEIGFTTGAGSLAPGANTGQIQNRFSKNDWSYYTQTGDYSFDPSKIQFADWAKVTVYRNGVLVWGIEP